MLIYPPSCSLHAPGVRLLLLCSCSTMMQEMMPFLMPPRNEEVVVEEIYTEEIQTSKYVPFFVCLEVIW